MRQERVFLREPEAVLFEFPHDVCPCQPHLGGRADGHVLLRVIDDDRLAAGLSARTCVLVPRLPISDCVSYG
jgi:hypothetical protein